MSQEGLQRPLLRPYQLEALEIMSDNKHQCLFDDMGLGKTVTSLRHLERNTDPDTDRILIICPTNAIYVWKTEIEKWTDYKSLIYWGTQTERARQLGEFINPKRNYQYLITSTGVFAELLDFGWRHIICDEIHRWGLLNHKTKASGLLRRLKNKVDQTILLTGTPIRQGCIDLFSPLQITTKSDRTIGADTYWHFVNKWCIVNETPFGKQIDRRPKDLEAFRNMWRQYAVRRLTEEVKADLPEKRRAVVPVVMTAKQRKAHKDIMKELMHLEKESDSLIVAQNKMVAGLRARQLLVSPRLLGIDEDGAALDYLKEVVPDYIYSDKPVVIFTPFRDAVSLISDAIWEVCKGVVDIYTLHGQMTPAQFADNWMLFQKDALGKKKVLICTIQSGAAFHATEAATCFFLGCEYDFNHNEQCEKRLHRLGQHEPVDCNYLLYEGDVIDQEVRDILNDKKRAATWILSSEQQYAELLAQVKREQEHSRG